MKLFVFSVIAFVISLLMGTGAAVFAQTATPTTVTSPTLTVSSPTTTSNMTPTPTGQVQGAATIPNGAPATGRGGK